MNLYLLMTALEICGGICTLIILGCILILRRSEMGRKQFDLLFILMCVAIALMLLSDSLARSFDGMTGRAGWIIARTMNPVEYLSNQAVQILFTLYLARSFAEFVNVKVWRVLTWVIAAVYAAMMIVNAFTGFIFTISATNVYTRGWGYGTFMIPAAVLQFWDVWMIMRYRSRLPQTIRTVGLVIAWLPLGGCAVQLFISQVPAIQLSCFALAVVVFFNVQSVFTAQMQSQQRQQIEQEHRMLVAQLQPHFLYNALLAIMGIDGNPPETVEAITSFSRYLRGSLNALKQENTIPAAQELKHVQAYVQLEQLRYGGKLQIRLDIQENSFYLPPLSLQMLVENAIRHGFSGMEEPGTVSITSKALEEWYMVTVEDNGCGFDVDALMKNPGSHVGLQSVKQRVESFCGGQLVIRSTPGVGTRASIMIPRYEAQAQTHAVVLNHHFLAEQLIQKRKGGKES